MLDFAGIFTLGRRCRLARGRVHPSVAVFPPTRAAVAATDASCVRLSPSGPAHLGSAMRATRRLDRNRHGAIWTIFRHRRSGRRRLLQVVHGFHDEANTESHDDKVNDQRNKVAVVPRNRPGLRGVCRGRCDGLRGGARVGGELRAGGVRGGAVGGRVWGVWPAARTWRRMLAPGANRGPG